MRALTRLLAISFFYLPFPLFLAGPPVTEVRGPKIALPMVAGAQVPLYPPLARAAHIQGIVHLKITTDGHRVITTRVEDGHKILAVAAEENAQTWQFATHEPTTFTVTYYYKLVDGMDGDPNNPTVILRLPTEVEVSTASMPPLD